MTHPTPPTRTPTPAPAAAPAADSIAGEEDPGAAVDAPAPPPHFFNSADKDAERSAPDGDDNQDFPARRR